MRFGLKEDTIAKIVKTISSNPKVEEAIIYGSRAKGNYRNGSDIDLTLKGEQLTIRDIFRLEDEIDDLFLPYKFDISIFHHIDNKELLEHIERVGLTLYKKPGF